MTHEERLDLITKVYHDIYKIAETKGREYSNGGDALGNFNRVAAECGVSPEMACWVYTKKHLDAIASYIRTGQEFSTEKIDGRIYDAVLYLILLLGIIQEKPESNQQDFSCNLDDLLRTVVFPDVDIEDKEHCNECMTTIDTLDDGDELEIVIRKKNNL